MPHGTSNRPLVNLQNEFVQALSEEALHGHTPGLSGQTIRDAHGTISAAPVP